MFWDSISSKAYWRYVIFSPGGAGLIFSSFGVVMVIVEALDFFKMFTRDEYASYALPLLFVGCVVFSVVIRRPISSIQIKFPADDFSVEVRVGDLFDASGAVMISTNSDFESDVAGGKIAIDSLQGQFTARYFTGNQGELISLMDAEIENIGTSRPFPMGTTIPVSTHGKTFYFTVMSDLNQGGTASTTPENVKKALDGLWKYVRDSGELQELAIPVIGTGRGRLNTPRKKMISMIAESFVLASREGKFTDHLVVIVRPEDASKWGVNLYDIKDHLNHVLQV